MDNSAARKTYPLAVHLYWALVLLVTFFFIFTPFEDEAFKSVLIPRILIIVSIFLVAPFIVLRPYRSIRPALILMAATLFHMTFFVPTEAVQLLAEWVGLISVVFFARMLVVRSQATAIAVSVLLLLNIAALAAQFFLVNIQNVEIDLHQLIFPVSEARTGQEAFQEFTRLGGFHLEPGTYCTWVAMLIVLSRLIRNKFGIIEGIAALSMLVTYSTAGIVYFVLIAIWFALDSLRLISARGIGLMIVLACGGVMLGSAAGVDRYILQRFGVSIATPTQLEEGADQLEWRKDALEFYKEMPLEEKLVGFGHTQEICENCYFDDFGFAPNMFLRGGVLGAVALLITTLMMIKLLGFNLTIMIIGIVGTAKAPTNSMAPWVVLFVASEIAVASARERRRQRQMR